MARRRLLASAAALLILAPACSGDDDQAGPSPPSAGAGGTAATATAGADTAAERVETAGTDDAAVGTASSAAAATVPATADETTTIPGADETTSTSTSSTTTTSVAATTTTTTIPGAVPVVEAASYTVYDMRAGRFLAQHEADAQRPVGSLMKLLTAQVAYDAGQPIKVVTAPSEGLVIDADESVIDIQGGQQLSRELLIRAMLKASANDAARLLALDIAGSEAAFAELMNAKAAELGLVNTHAVNVTGLDAEGQYSSANDMTALGARLMSDITFQVTVRDDTAELNGQAYPNTNDLLGIYPGADGIKTGRTTGAGWCLLASAIRDGRRIVVAVLGAPTEDARDAAATALLDWGFAQPL
jgi:D-alanyl-D-alanine carboxypeptidase (penicillin-binding protein 5/6)